RERIRADAEPAGVIVGVLPPDLLVLESAEQVLLEGGLAQFRHLHGFKASPSLDTAAGRRETVATGTSWEGVVERGLGQGSRMGRSSAGAPGGVTRGGSCAARERGGVWDYLPRDLC